MLCTTQAGARVSREHPPPHSSQGGLTVKHAMPELPEVEAARSILDHHARGLRILEVRTAECGGGPRDGQEDDIVLPPVDSLRAALLGKRLIATGRRGKLQWMVMEGGGLVSFHFGMTGAFSWKIPGAAALPSKFKRYTVDTSEWPPKFCKLELVFEGGKRLAFT